MDTPTGTDAELQEVIDAFLQGKLTEPQAEQLASCDAATLKRVMLATSARIAEQNARIAELESQVAALLQQNAQLVQQNATLSNQVSQLSQQVAKLSEQVAKLSKNSSNSSKPPSSDIVKPPGPKRPDGKPPPGRAAGASGRLARGV